MRLSSNYHYFRLIGYSRRASTVETRGRGLLPGLAAATALLLVLSATGPVQAASSSTANDPGLIERRIRERTLPEPPADAAVPRIRAPEVVSPDAVEALEVVLAGIAVEGATALAPADFVPLYQAFLGQTVTATEIELIVARITDLYREKGFFLSTAVAPPQEIVGGVVRVQVIEGYVESVSVQKGERRRTELDPYLRPILDERPLKLSTLERGVLLINDLPGIEAAAAMRCT